MKKYRFFLLTANDFVGIFSCVMANQRISKEKRALILSALGEGTPINAVCRMFKVGKNGVLRVIAETGEAFADYMDRNFRDLPCERIEMDEQWQYVGCHGQRMDSKEKERGDFWLWAAIDPDTKLVFSHTIGTRRNTTGTWFVQDVADRVTGPVQIATDNNRSYACNIRGAFHGKDYAWGTDNKIFGERDYTSDSQRKNGIAPIVSTERKTMIGSPDLGTVTTSHIERVFLSVRQECTRFSRLTLGYSKDLDMHKAATALYFGTYNFVRKHKTLGTTPAVAAGLEESRWTLEQVVEMTDAYWKPRYEAQKAANAAARRSSEDRAFARAFAEAGL
jgi:IS1 family transposase